MPITNRNLPAELDRVRANFDVQLAEMLLTRPDLTQAEIQAEFGISDKVIRRVVRQFQIRPRKRGPKPQRSTR